MSKFVCIHGHFYQPPRENPWLEAIELQDTAYPYHDWNERIAAESYGPNAASRILDEDGRIVGIVNNYSRISFNFGPTLLAWLEAGEPEVYEAVMAADRDSAKRFDGHGSAMAQAYNHMILPLAAPRDRETQVRWGLADFRRRFGREPEGMWLPETAVDLASLDVLAQHGIKFTVLAPHQAAAVRRIDGGTRWVDVAGSRIDPTRPYLQRLPSGKSIAIFFYDGPASRGVAFEGLLTNGKRFAERLLGLFHEHRGWPEIVSIATDGETYGHHHRHGEMALSYALQIIEETDGVALTNYAAYLERFPPTHEVRILEETSWSCAHGIERWRGDCGCATGGQPGWHQRWRQPLREALDWLRDEVAGPYEDAAADLLADPWAARDEYIDVLLDRSRPNVEGWLQRHGARELSAEDATRALKLLELQRHGLLMYTSCGWFFNELSGIETVQVIQYGGRVVQLARELFGADLEPPFVQRLERAESNIPDQGNGRQIYERYVKPAMVDLLKVGGHYAASSIFEPYAERTRIYCYTVDRYAGSAREAGEARLVLGRARIASIITREAEDVTFAVLGMGDHNLNGGIRPFMSDDAFNALDAELARPFSRADLAAVIRLLDRNFPDSTFSLKSLFRDEQRRVLDSILDTTLGEATAVYRNIYEHHAPLMRFLLDLGMPLPTPFRIAADFTLNTELRRVIEADPLDLERARQLLDEARAGNVVLDRESLGFALRVALERLADRLGEAPSELERLHALQAAAGFARAFPADASPWHTQNVFYNLLRTTYIDMEQRARQGEPEARAWTRDFRALGEALHVAVPEGDQA